MPRVRIQERGMLKVAPIPRGYRPMTIYKCNDCQEPSKLTFIQGHWVCPSCRARRAKRDV
jgi:DNA-directed RNA polymerase subunit RPC12/RpoP